MVDTLWEALRSTRRTVRRRALIAALVNDHG